MAIFSSLFKQQKPKQFGYKPVYYDAEKEAREKRIERIKKENENSEFRNMLREKWRKNHLSSEVKKSNIRILLIAALLALICYLLLR